MFLITFRALSGQCIAADEKLRRLKPAEIVSVLKTLHITEDLAQDWGRGKAKVLANLVRNGTLSFEFDGKRLWTVTTYECDRELTGDELTLLADHTRKQWNEGRGYLFAQVPCAKLGKDLLEEVYLYPGAEGQELAAVQTKVRKKRKSAND